MGNDPNLLTRLCHRYTIQQSQRMPTNDLWMRLSLSHNGNYYLSHQKFIHNTRILQFSTTTRRILYNNGTTAQNYRKIETEDADNQQLLATITNIQPTYIFLLTEESTKNTSVPSIIPDITISPPLAKQFNSQEDQLQSNVSDIGTEADYNISITDMRSIYLPITTDKHRESTDKQL